MKNVNARMKRWLLPVLLSFGLSLPVLAQGIQDQQNSSDQTSYRLAQAVQNQQGGILRKADQARSGQENTTVGLYDSPALANLDNDLSDPNDTDNAGYGVMFWVTVCAIVAAMMGLILYGMIRTKRSESRV